MVPVDLFLDDLPKLVHVDAQAGEDAVRGGASLPEQAECQIAGADRPSTGPAGVADRPFQGREDRSGDRPELLERLRRPAAGRLGAELVGDDVGCITGLTGDSAAPA